MRDTPSSYSDGPGPARLNSALGIIGIGSAILGYYHGFGGGVLDDVSGAAIAYTARALAHQKCLGVFRTHGASVFRHTGAAAFPHSSRTASFQQR